MEKTEVRRVKWMRAREFSGRRLGASPRYREVGKHTVQVILTRVDVENVLRSSLMFFKSCKSSQKFLLLACSLE